MDYFFETLVQVSALTGERNLDLIFAQHNLETRYIAGHPGTHASTPDIVPALELEYLIRGPNGRIEIDLKGNIVISEDVIEDIMVDTYLTKIGFIPLTANILEPDFDHPTMDFRYWESQERRHGSIGFTLAAGDVYDHRLSYKDKELEGLGFRDAFNVLLDYVEGKKTLQSS